MKINETYKRYKNNEIDFNEIYEHFMPIVYNILRMNKLYKVDIDDYIQEGSLVLWDCLNDYKENNNYTFSTYLGNKLRWRFIEYSFLDNTIKKPYYLYDNNIDKTKIKIIGQDIKIGGQDINIIDIVSHPESPEDKIISKIDLEKRLDSLSFQEISILELMKEGYSQPKIAKKLSMGNSTVHGKIRNIKKKLIKQWSHNEIKILKLNMNFDEHELSKALDKYPKEVNYAKEMVVRDEL